MLLDARQPEKPAGVLIDTGTGRRIPYARKADFDTGEYEAFVEGPDPDTIIVGEWDVPLVVKGKAVGQLKLVPLDQAYTFGLEQEPRKVKQAVQPMTADQKLVGLEQYKEVYTKVWNEMRGEARRCVDDRWLQFLSSNDFLDNFIIKRRIVRVG